MTACMQQSQSGQLWTIRYERAKNQLPFLRCKSKSRVLHMIPVDSTTEAVGRPPTPPLQPDQPPTLTPFKEPAWPPWAPSARVPVKSCLKYSRGLLSISMHSRVQGPESVTSAPPSNTTTAPLSLPFGYTRPPRPPMGSSSFCIENISSLTKFLFRECHLLIWDSQYDPISYQHPTCWWHTIKQSWAKFTSQDDCVWWGPSDITKGPRLLPPHKTRSLALYNQARTSPLNIL